MSCDTCPDLIVETIAADVRDMLWKVRRIQRLGTTYSRFMEEMGLSYLDVIQRRMDELYALIPEPPILDVPFLLKLITCPLTPIALGLEPSLIAQLDPTSLLKRFQGMTRNYMVKLEVMYDMTIADIDASDPRPLSSIIQSDIEAARTSDDLVEFFAQKTADDKIQYDANGNPVERQSVVDHRQASGYFDPSSVTANTRQFLDSSYTKPTPNRTIQAGGANGILLGELSSPKSRIEERTASTNIPVRVVRKYVREVVSAVEDPIYFAGRFAITAAAVEGVRATCSETYNSERWPFVLWDDHVRGFGFDSSTGMPSGLPFAAQRIVSTFMQIEMKLARWNTFATTAI